MSRVKNYKIFLVLAVIVAGVVCMFLPDKNPVPVASMSGALEKNDKSNDDTIAVLADKQLEEDSLR